MKLGMEIKAYLDRTGRKQTFLSQKTGIELKRLNALLNENRKMYADEYLEICRALNVPFETFLSPQQLQPTGS